MEGSTLILIVLGILSIIGVVCTIVLYPELRDFIKEFNRDS